MEVLVFLLNFLYLKIILNQESLGGGAPLIKKRINCFNPLAKRKRKKLLFSILKIAYICPV